ncbi:Metaxin-2 [Irineochytrium annulatum]|nr:Metaxin-2 [Irineochytrium annulatum]
MQYWRQFRDAFPLKTFPPPWTPPPKPSENVLFVFPRRKQPTSQEVESIQMQAFLVVAGYPHKVEECYQSDVSPSGRLPFLLTTGGKVLAGREIIDEVTAEAGDPSAALGEPDKSDVLAFSALVECKVHQAVIYALWCEEKNCLSISYPLYEDNYVWPLNIALSRLTKTAAFAWLLTRKATLDKDEIYEDAKNAFAALSAKLGDKLYLFGAKYEIIFSCSN